MLLTSSFPSSLQRVLWECARIMLWHTRQSLGNCQTRGFLIYQLSAGFVCIAWAPGCPPRVPLVHLSRGPACIPKGHFTGLEFPPKQTQLCIWDHSGLLSQTGKVLQDQALGLNYEGLDFLLQLGGEKNSMKRMSFKQKLLGNNLRGHWIFG